MKYVYCKVFKNSVVVVVLWMKVGKQGSKLGKVFGHNICLKMMFELKSIVTILQLPGKIMAVPRVMFTWHCLACTKAHNYLALL